MELGASARQPSLLLLFSLLITLYCNEKKNIAKGNFIVLYSFGMLYSLVLTRITLYLLPGDDYNLFVYIQNKQRIQKLASL